MRRTAARPIGSPGVIGVDVLTRPVPPLGLQEDDRVPAGDRMPQQPVGIRRGRRHHDFQARGVRPVGFRGLRMVFDRTDSAERRDADRHRHVHVAVGAHRYFARWLTIWSNAGCGEPVELDLGDRDEAADRQPDRDADDRRLGQRCVETALPSPKVSARPSVTRKTPPSVATSSPNTRTRSSAAIASCSARLIACTIVRFVAVGTA